LHYRNRIRCIKKEGGENYEASKSKDISDIQDRISNEVKTNGSKTEIPFLAMIAIALGIAAIATLASIRHQPILGSLSGLQILSEGSSSAAVAPVAAGFTFKVFGFSVIVPQYAPGYPFFLFYFFLCHLFQQFGSYTLIILEVNFIIFICILVYGKSFHCIAAYLSVLVD
jgi:hypothetical protein